MACGVGYGAAILAESGHRVLAVDREPEAITFGRVHYGSPKIAYLVGDANTFMPAADRFDAATCFETIEHLEDPRPMLRGLAQGAPTLFASVPNEEMFPFQNYRFHFRHYTWLQFYELLLECGWEVTEWWGQHGPESEVERGVNGRTAIVIARRVTRPLPISEELIERGQKMRDKTHRHLIALGWTPPDEAARGYEESHARSASVAPSPHPRGIPKTVAILGLGPTLREYVGIATCMGGTARFADEIWGINAAIDVVKCDLGFHMDDPLIQEARAAANPDGNIASMLPWLRKHPGPIFTSRPHPDYPGLIAYPLQDVLNSCNGQRYFNSTAAYAVAYAIHIGVKTIKMAGFDFSYEHSHKAEKGRGNVEFFLGMACARGILIGVIKNSPLLDACVPNNERLYGYDTLTVEITKAEDGSDIVSFSPREEIPSAEEIEGRYDHSQKTVPQHILEGGGAES